MANSAEIFDQQISEEIIVENFIESYGTVESALVTDLRLGDAAARIAIYLKIKPNFWKANRVDIQKALGFGKDKWRAARKQLIEAGYFKCRKIRRENGRFSHQISFNPFAWKTAGSSAAPPHPDNAPLRSSVSHHGKPGAGFPAPVEPALDEPAPANTALYQHQSYQHHLDKHQPPRAREAREAPAAGGGGVFLKVLKAGGLPLDDAVFSRRLAATVAGARDEQARWAAEVVLAARASGKAADLMALAIAMAKKAAAGTVTAPPAPAAGVGTPAPPSRARFEGHSAMLDDGRIVVVAPGSAGAFWRRQDGSLLGGTQAATLWALVDNGKLDLRPPAA
ncbi:hypothetical protein [Variovorax sp. EL159]|uniref:hypothetical protein n=1 Tax=Variovorax sp. EL159 TaxID=1566270 RepID=UPI00088F4F54|nr:hypothetical protein [Variovorax sp. EL159]SCX48796.1 hypothetical protein SAMN03159363_1223 [Variovorax sp. EL159]